jgi:hypothetical protein
LPKPEILAIRLRFSPRIIPVQDDLWYAAVLLVPISLVYAATRHEAMSDILRASLRIGAWFGGFLAVAMLLVYFLEAWAF